MFVCKENSFLEPTYENFKIKHTRIPICTFVSNQASVLDAFCNLLLILSVGLHAVKLNLMCHTLP
jgi:hypothetical protein